MFKNKFLIANSNLTDPVFAGKVILIFNHDKKLGAQGIILNANEVGKVGFGEVQTGMFDNLKPPKSIEEANKLISSQNFNSVPVYLGGPCKTASIFMLHGYEEFFQKENSDSEYDLGIADEFNLFENLQYKESYEVTLGKNVMLMPGVYFGSPDVFCEIISSGKVSSESKFKFYTGQSIWEKGQLEKEVEGGAWTVIDAKPEIFFDFSALEELSESIRGKSPSKWFFAGFDSSGFDPQLN